MLPDVDHLILPLIDYRHRHNIQAAGYYLHPSEICRCKWASHIRELPSRRRGC